MSTNPEQTTRRQVAVVAFSLALAAAGLAMVLAAGGSSLISPWQLPWLLLVPAYVLTLRLPVYFEFRREAHGVALVQLPLAVGAVLVGPLGHAAARAVASTTNSFVLRRQGWLKWLFNLAVGLLEVGIVSLAINLGALETGSAPGPSLWWALLLGLLGAEIASNLAVTVLMRLLGVPSERGQLLQPVVFALVTSVIFTAVSILSLTAAWTEPASLVIVAGLLAGLAFAYRAHRRLQAQQADTENLFAFVTHLGPVHASDNEGVSAVLAEVRELLRASVLDLALADPGGGWRHVTVTHDGAAPPAHLSALVSLDGGPRVGDSTSQQMSTPLYNERGVMAILSAFERVGENRDFDMADHRLMQTIGTELTTALERGRLLADLSVAASTDGLTGQPNLVETCRLVDALLTDTGGVLVAAVTVDSFREVNDTLGHQVGDELLLEVTRRLHAAVPEALIGRIGGGRFAVAVPGTSFSGSAELLGLRLRSQVEGGAQLGPISTHVRLSVGCTRGPEHGTDAETLVRRAETAMYSARNAQGGPVLWEPAYEVSGQRRLAVVMALREALVTGAIGLAFQPKVSAHTGEITGVEALARWTHPALGAITPDEFIPLAEASGLMGPLTATVLRQALDATKGWQRSAPTVGVAVNVSAETVLDDGFASQLRTILSETQTHPSLLTLELTEGVVVDDAALAAERLSQLRQLGVRVSVDDFGTGYSSLTYLKGLPVDEVKIDKGFVRNLVEDPADRAVVRAVVDIAHTLGIKVVAEGVEQDDQQQVLRLLGVDELQGYLLARPMPAVDMALWLRRHPTHAPLQGLRIT